MYIQAAEGGREREKDREEDGCLMSVRLGSSVKYAQQPPRGGRVVEHSSGRRAAPRGRAGRRGKKCVEVQQINGLPTTYVGCPQEQEAGDMQAGPGQGGMKGVLDNA